MQHVINKQRIELLLDDPKTAFQLQEQASKQFYNRMLPILERVFDRLSADDELVSIDRLVIDLGAVTPEALGDGSWTEDLYRKVLELGQQIIRDGDVQRRPVRRPLGEGIVAQWLDYMRTGRVAWNVMAIDDLWLRRMLEHLAADHAAVMLVRAALAADGPVLQRLVVQHGERFLVSLAEVLTAKNQAGLPAALRELEAVVRELVVIRSAAGVVGRVVVGLSGSHGDGRLLWRAALQLAAEGGGVRGVTDIVRELVGRLALRPTEVLLLRPRLAGRMSAEGAVAVALAADAVVAVEDSGRWDGMDGEGKCLPVADGRVDRRDVGATSSKAAMEEELAEGIFVAFAGLVILHPFLGTFLSRLGLVADGVFVDEAARARAVLLVQYLATGIDNHPEYELVMAKLLCAWPSNEPMECVAGMTAEEREEADGLLDACLGQWTALQNTSRDGLRGNFLIRGGKLFRQGGLLRLEVERSPFDMLLDQLPWNLSLVRLPWMPEVLYVNWR
jgi:hypothetical protein